MPFKSQAQAKLFFAAKAGKLKGEGPDPEVAKKFIKDTEHQKIGNLPEYKKNKFPKLKKYMSKG